MKRLLIIWVVLFFCGCEQQAVVIVKDPVPANMVAPAVNEVCTSGTNISSTQSLIMFKWLAADNTDLYELHVKNLSNGQISLYTTSKKELEITLLRNTPYSWFIVSKSNKSTKTAQGLTWKFYNSGAGALSYAPFPAEIVSPVMGQTVTTASGKISLDWTASDVDNDISGYDVFISTDVSPMLYKTNIKDSNLNDLVVSSNTTYYWKIITRDSQGNTSDSGVYQFTVK